MLSVPYILRLGVPGLFVAWLVTPVVIVFMYQFGVRFLRIRSRSLVMVIAAATSVCGVSAAIAVAAAARAHKQELTLAVGMSLIFTVAMMILMPLGIRWTGMDPVVGAAWIGGTVDATGAVVAAGAILGEQAEQIAAVVLSVGFRPLPQTTRTSNLDTRLSTQIANLETRLVRWMVGTVIATATLTVGILRLIG